MNGNDRRNSGRRNTAQTSTSLILEERGGAIPTARLLPLVTRYEREHDTIQATQGTLARRFYKVRHEASYVSFTFADQLLVDMGLEHEWHCELVDIYEAA